MDWLVAVLDYQVEAGGVAFPLGLVAAFAIAGLASGLIAAAVAPNKRGGYAPMPDIVSVDDSVRVAPPWSPDQVASLNAFQTSGLLHPFTCPRWHPDAVALVATEYGWTCPVKPCQYAQNWAHGYMADWTWKTVHGDVLAALAEWENERPPGPLTADETDIAAARRYRPPAELVEQVTESTRRRMAAALGSTPSAAAVAELAADAARRAFGCTCRHHSDPGAVYVEDVTCPIHGHIPRE